MSEERRFPVLKSWQDRSRDQRKLSIPWSAIEPHERQAKANHYQTLKQLAGRGGLSWSEMVAVLEDREWRAMDDAAAEARVRELCAVKP
jgi:hypothetical protein